MAQQLGQLLIVLTAVRTVTAARAGDEESNALVLDEGEAADTTDLSNFNMLDLTGNTQMICGGAEIWGELTAGGDLESAAQNVNWAKMESYKKAHIEDQNTKLEILRSKLKQLAERLLKEEKAQNVAHTALAQHKTLLNKAVGSFQGFKDVEIAARWRCGKLTREEGSALRRWQKQATEGSSKPPDTPPKHVRDGFDGSVKAMEKEAPLFFSGMQYRLDGPGFLKDCRALLKAEEKEDSTTGMSTYCPTLCQQLKDRAESASLKAVGVAAGVSDKIKDEMRQVKEEITSATESVEHCETDWSAIVIFKDQLTDLKATYDKCWNEFMDADREMGDLEWDLMDLQDQLLAGEEELGKARESLNGATQATKDAQSALDAIDAQEKSLKAKLGDLSLALSKLKGKLINAQSASSKIGQLKEWVTSTMMVMASLAEESLREPLLNLGFFEEPEALLNQFPDPLSTDGATALKEALTKLESFCQQTAMPVFTEIKQVANVDMTPMCNIKDADANFKDLSEHVQKRTKAIQEDLLQVVSWLNPWKATKLSLEEGQKHEEELVKQGQLAYVTQVMPIYAGNSNFFKYLVQWRLKGKHHVLIASLKAAMVELSKQEAIFNKTLDETKVAWKETKDKRAQALAKLEKAKVEEAKVAGNAEELEKTLADLKEEGIRLNREFDDWMAKLEKAKRELAEAKQALVSTYGAGTGRGLIEVGTGGSLHWSHAE